MPRELAWKDTFVEKLVQEITDDSCTGSSVLLDTDYNYIALELTEEQWTILFSALKTGADLSYGEMSHEVVWWWLKGVECAMTFCEKMIECMLMDEDTKEAMIQGIIAELLADNIQAEAFVSAMREIGVGISGGNSQTGSPNEPLNDMELYDCTDMDELYGKAYSATQAFTDGIQELFEWFELFTNDEELASLLADNVPAIGALPASILETAQWLQETARETFESAWDTTSHEYWACKIFCLVASGDCVLSIDVMRQAYRDELSAFSPPSSTSDLPTFLAWLVDLLTLTDNELIGAVHLFVLEIWVRTGELFGSSFRTLQIAVETATPIEAPCSCCVNLLFPFDTNDTATVVLAEGQTVGTTIWQSHTWSEGVIGAWRAGQQYFIASPATPSRYGFIKIEVDPDCYYDGFSVEMKTTITSGDNESNNSVALYDTDVIPRLADNYFTVESHGYPQPEIQTISGNFTSRQFPDGYVVIGFGTSAAYADQVIRIRDFQLNAT